MRKIDRVPTTRRPVAKILAGVGSAAALGALFGCSSSATHEQNNVASAAPNLITQIDRVPIDAQRTFIGTLADKSLGCITVRQITGGAHHEATYTFEVDRKLDKSLQACETKDTNNITDITASVAYQGHTHSLSFANAKPGSASGWSVAATDDGRRQEVGDGYFGVALKTAQSLADDALGQRAPGQTALAHLHDLAQPTPPPQLN